MKSHPLQQHFRDLLAPLFPQGADFNVASTDSDELKFVVAWRMPTPERPNKRSRPIELHLTSELLDDYSDSQDMAFRSRGDKRIIEHVKGRLVAFNPNHNLPAAVPVPSETWVLSTNLLGR
jgi:hypothetical protein